MSHLVLEGGCQCGAVRYRLSGEPVFTALCHCTMCRRASGAPAVGWALYGQPQVEFTSGPPGDYESSPGCHRRFCRTCGTPVAFTADYLDGLVDITIGSLDDPSALAPGAHIWASKQLPWLRLADDAVPRHDGFPPAPPSA